MISVVVPTMWRYEPFPEFVSYIVKLDVVKEVIIINNDYEKTPNDSLWSNPKIKIYSFGRNIYVNPAWNFGISTSTEDRVCIMNDDITFDLKLFYKVDEFLTDDMGSLGLNSNLPDPNLTPTSNGSIVFDPYVGQRCFGWGNLMFIHKKHWRPIPSDLNIWYGDNYIFDYYFFNGYTNYFISNLFHFHDPAKTSASVIIERREEIIAEEHAKYQQIKQKLMSRTY